MNLLPWICLKQQLQNFLDDSNEMTLRGEAALPLRKDPECPCDVKCPVTDSSSSSKSTELEKKHQWFLQYAEMPKPVQKIETLCQDRLFLETISQALLRIDMLAKYAIYIEKSLDIDEEIKDAHDDDDDDQDNDDDDAYVDNNSQIDDDDDDDDDNDPAPEPDTDYYNPYLSSKKEIYDAFCPITLRSLLNNAKKAIHIAEKMCDQWADSPFARRRMAAMQAKKDIGYKFFQAKIDFYLANMLFSKIEKQKDPFRKFQKDQD